MYKNKYYVRVKWRRSDAVMPRHDVNRCPTKLDGGKFSIPFSIETR